MRPRSTTRNYGYNADGNTIALLGKTYTYDPFNRLNKITGGGSTTTYDVNALGERVYKNRDGVESFYAYAPDHTLLADYVRNVTGWSDIVRIGGEPVALTRLGVLYFVHDDHLGRPEVVTNAAKTVVWRAKNLAFDRTVSTDTLGGLNLGLPGQYYDQETGTWYNVNRDYDPVVGRYLQSDPIGLAGGTNPYSYADSNPLMGFDPFGLVDLNLFSPNDPLYGNANAVQSPDGVFTVGGHGTPYGMVNATGVQVNAQQLADQITNNPKWKDGMRVELDACNTGADPGDGSEPFAAQLAAAMGVPASGASNFVWIYPSGKVVVAPTTTPGINWSNYTPSAGAGGSDMKNPGGFVTYVPIGR